MQVRPNEQELWETNATVYEQMTTFLLHEFSHGEGIFWA